jgi:hypothetical protein
MAAFVAVNIFVVGWPYMVVYCAFAGAIGAVISQKRSGGIGPGIWAGIGYALLSLVVFVIVAGFYAVITYHG